MKTRFSLGLIKGSLNAQKVRTLFFNRFKVEVQLLATSSADTEFSFDCFCDLDKKPTFAQASQLMGYFHGIKDTLQSIS